MGLRKISDGASSPRTRGLSTFDRMHGLIRRQVVTNAARHEGGQLREGLIARTNTSSSVWADSAYRSAENEDWLEARCMVSRIHRKKRCGRAMPK